MPHAVRTSFCLRSDLLDNSLMASTCMKRPLSILVGPEDANRLTGISVGLAPCLDYRLVAEQCQGVIRPCYPAPAALRGPKLARAVRSISGNLRLAVQIVRAMPREGLIYSTGETWGLPVGFVSAAMGRRQTHVVYAHRVYSPVWLWLMRCLRSFLHVDGWICITRFQADLLQRVLGARGAPVAVVSQGVDTRFFDPSRATDSGRPPYILSVGAEMRNYALLLDAARSLRTDVVIKASSSWMTNMRRTIKSVPPNVQLIAKSLSYCELRDLYAGAACIVVPLFDTPQAAGITTILEAMAMNKCVIATRSSGLPDVMVDGCTGVIVEQDSSQLAQAIQSVLSQPQWANELAANAFSRVRQEASLESHAAGVLQFLMRAAVSFQGQ